MTILVLYYLGGKKMINNSNIVSVHSNISFDYGDCGIEMTVNNDYVTFKATRVSEKGFIINRSITVKRKNNYENIVNFINKHRAILLLLLEKVEKKAKEYDEKIYDIGN